MVDRGTLIGQLDEWLQPDLYRDYCPNGLQLDGKHQVGHVVTAVTASQHVIEHAVEAGADLLLVHHGWFWKNENPTITGIKYRRVRALMDAGISLVAYHLPLDCHPELGNNACLARLMGWVVDGQVRAGGTEGLLWYGHLHAPASLEQLCEGLERVLGRRPLPVSGHDRPINTIAWCTGAAQGFIETAAALGVDAYISGEISEPTYHLARELGIHYIAAGHHATERYGVQALGAALEKQLGVTWQFVDEPNPV